MSATKSPRPPTGRYVTRSSAFHRPNQSYSPVKPVPNRQDILGFEGNENQYGGSQSGSDEDLPLQQQALDSILSMKYKALQSQLRQKDEEREQLQSTMAKLREKVRSSEQRLLNEENDRKNQLNIMKSVHEQAVSEKNRLISLFESVVHDQENEVDALRKLCNRTDIPTYPDTPNSSSVTAVTKLTTHLNQVLEEKNSILAQFFSQQQLIKDQQQELKSLLRLRSENSELQRQLRDAKQSVNGMRNETDTDKLHLNKLQAQIDQLTAELSQERLPKDKKSERVKKLEDQVNKLQDRVMIKEAELAEKDIKYREEIQVLNAQKIEKDREIRNIKKDLLAFKTKEPEVVQRMVEVPVESPASKVHISSLQKELNIAKSEHEKIRASLNEEIVRLEQQVKQKGQEMNELRQQTADHIVEFEKRRAEELDELESRCEGRMKYLSLENAGMGEKLKLLKPALQQIGEEYKRLKESVVVLKQEQQLNVERSAADISKAIQSVDQHNKDMVRKYHKEMSLRKKYHNELVELKGNIRVFCRVRPVIKEDQSAEEMAVVSIDADDEDVLVILNRGGREQRFDMDKVFTSNFSQQQVFGEMKALVTSVVDGYNVCIFAYGQTGSGKTYTMEGPTNDPGINQRALSQLFLEAEDRSKDWQFDIQVSAVEIYNETLRDLLASESTDKLEIKLQQDGSLHVPGLTWVTVKNVHDVNRTFTTGHNNRATASTNMNEHSSRSHALLCVKVTGVNKTTGAKTLGKLNLVDLAGSERVSKSGADGARLKETQCINKSLSSLGDVIAALRSKQSFVPYRNSKLTYLLQDSLGGDSKTLMIVQVAPVERHVSETLCSLNFALRVRTVELGAATKKTDSAEMSALKGRLAQYEQGNTPKTPTKSNHNTPLRKK